MWHPTGTMPISFSKPQPAVEILIDIKEGLIVIKLDIALIDAESHAHCEFP